ncbi:MAG: glycosyltransferase family 2 protein [Spirochaetes bacterium]|nr:glycosyltransferase family 2 protein [Spirochaetota bacterium]
MTPQVDVVIPAFGRTDLLGEAIASVLAQSYPHFTLTVVDDASPVPLENAVRVRDMRLRWLRLEKTQGPGAARNAGAALADAPYIAFLDSDDLWAREKLAEQVAFLEAHRALSWVHTHEVWQRNGITVKQKAEHRKQGGQFLIRAFERCLISPSAVMLRRNFFEASGGFHEPFFVCEDFELWLRLLAQAPVGYIDMPLTIKRAGAWPQLSTTRELDRYRVLALHRFWRLNRHKATMKATEASLLSEATKKTTILLKGALKYGHTAKARRYQAWLTLFNARRTRAIR